MPTFKQIWNAVMHHTPIDPATDRVIEALGNLPLNLAIITIVSIGLMAWISFDDWRKQFRARRWRGWSGTLHEQESSWK